MTLNQPVRKLNKKLIYCSLMGLMALGIPAIISIASSGKAERNSHHKLDKPQPNNFAHDAVAIAGMERFPKTYGDVTQFESDLASKKHKEEDIVRALAEIETHAPAQASARHQETPSGYRSHQDNPWHEAKEREQKQKANDHYDAKRSDIMFVNNARNKDGSANDDGMAKMMDKALALADNSINQPLANPNDMLLMKSDDTGSNHRGFLGSKGRDVGGVKEPSQFMISEGTLLHAILLSEINTDLPGPILARVSHNIWDSKTGQILLIPQNSKLVGEYNSSVGHGQNRAQIVWTRIIYPNQQSVDLGRMIGVDKKGTSGSAGTVDNHYDNVAFALLLSTTLGAGVRMTQGKYDPNSASIGQDVGNSLAQETARFGSRVADKMLSIKPTITISIGERLNVFVEQDLHLKPYSG